MAPITHHRAYDEYLMAYRRTHPKAGTTWHVYGSNCWRPP
jgi:hypothetical protein